MEKVSSKPLISVVVPIYNVEKYLYKCIESIVNQTYTNLEIILVDDGSPDNCPHICDEYAKKDKRIVVIHKKNGGLSDARNAGINIAKGEYLTFIDSDDYIENNYIEVLYNLIKKYNSKISMVEIRRVFENDKVYDTSTNSEFVLTKEDFFEKMLYGERDLDNSASAKLYHRSLFEDIRYPVGRLYEDTATTYKIILKCDSIPVNSVSLYNYMIRRNSIVQGVFNEKKLQLILSTNEMTDEILKNFPNLASACLRKKTWSYLSTLSQMALSKYNDKKEIEKLRSFVILNKKELLNDKRLSKRDKYGVKLICINYNLYKIIWRLYTKIKY